MSAGRGAAFGRAEEAPEGYPRLFVAVPLDEVARGAVVALADEVRSVVEAVAREPRSEVRWVRMDGLHLTLRFLGATDPARVADVVGIVDQAASSGAPFRVGIARAGAFPSPARPRTLWLAVTQGQDELGDVVRRLDEGLVTAGWPHDDRPLRAHLTLARADGRREGPLVARTLAQRAEAFQTAFVADRVVLFESLTGGGPARYGVIHEAPFRG